MDPKDLHELLQQHAQDLLDGGATAADLTARINGAEHVAKNSARITTVTLLDTLTQVQYTALRTVLDAQAAVDPYLKGINEALAGAGLLFSDDRAQAFIESLRPAIGDETTDILLGLGVTRTPVLPAPVTEAEVQTALDWALMSARITNAVSLVRERMQAHMSAAEQVAVWADAWIDSEA